jgi:hypothetical protein
MIGNEISFAFEQKDTLDKSKHLDHIDVALYKTFDYHKSNIKSLDSKCHEERCTAIGILNNSKHGFKISGSLFFCKSASSRVSKNSGYGS